MSRRRFASGLIFILCTAVSLAPKALAQRAEPPLRIEPSDRAAEIESRAPGRLGEAVSAIPSPSLGAGVRYQALGDALRERGDASCVDAYYRATVVAYACMQGEPGDRWSDSLGQALTLYNTNLGLCLHAASRFGRLKPSSQLIVNTPSGRIEVPISHAGFLWASEDFSKLVDPASVPKPKNQQRPHLRPGLGARSACVRHGRTGDRRAFLPLSAAFPVTAVLEPDLDAWLDRQAGRPPRDQLVFCDPLRVKTVAVGGREYRLAADLDAGLAVMQEIVGAEQFRIDGFLRPSTWMDRAGIYFLEPFQPGKIPVVMVHGLASTPWTWSDLIGDLRADPEFLERYQIWVFVYPTGVPFLNSAAILREELTRAVETMDPTGNDLALHRIVLIGHSMGGLLSKLQASASEDLIWNTFSQIRYEEAVVAPEIRESFERAFFFEPQPDVERVIYIATPHRGSHIANAAGGRLASTLVQAPAEAQVAYQIFKQDNPGALRRPFRRFPTSVDLLRKDNDLLKALLKMPRSERVSFHTIAGVGKPDPINGEASDGVVPLSSARLPGVASELLVPATHGTIHHHPETIAEVRRILDEHLMNGPSSTRTRRDAVASRRSPSPAPALRPGATRDPTTAPAGYLPEPP